MTGDWPDTPAARPLWLVTLADLALLLVGFLVLVAVHRGEPERIAAAMRRGFAAAPAGPTVRIGANRLPGFAPGSAALPAQADAIVDWARAELRDPRVAVTVTGSAGATAADVDPQTGSAAILAVDRARALAVRIAPLAPGRIAVAAEGGPAAATLTLSFSGEPAPLHRTDP